MASASVTPCTNVTKPTRPSSAMRNGRIIDASGDEMRSSCVSGRGLGVVSAAKNGSKPAVAKPAPVHASDEPEPEPEPDEEDLLF